MTAPLHPLRVAVIGLGNVFLGDDGFGPLVIEKFRCQFECEPSVEIHDLGTPGLDLAPYLYRKDLIVLVDAVHAEGPPGTLSFYNEDDFVSRNARLRVTGHDPGLWDSLAHLRLADPSPLELIIIGVVPESCRFGEGIAPVLLDRSSIAVAGIAGLLMQRGVACRRRRAAIQPNLWWLPFPGAELATTSIEG
jgi:hydrogenase maturation protease